MHFFSFSEIGPQPLWNYTHTDKLRHDLLLNYDKFARPAQHYNATMVQFDLTIKHIELNEFKSTLAVNGWLTLVRIFFNCAIFAHFDVELDLDGRETQVEHVGLRRTNRTAFGRA